MAEKKDYIKDSLTVDGGFSLNGTGVLQYKGVLLNGGEANKEVFHIKFPPLKPSDEPNEQQANNIGEFLALVNGLAWLKERDLNIVIYSDSTTAISWVKKGKHNSSVAKSWANGSEEDAKKLILAALDKANKWLENNKPNTDKVEFWGKENLSENGKKWGNIPADCKAKLTN
ncbi:hypothetical protein FACS189487_01310 [Campylobacterota bacterium]|nr:hypothetical protein FACS189487_01310 [Campylobacterota bacterium]